MEELLTYLNHIQHGIKGLPHRLDWEWIEIINNLAIKWKSSEI